MLMFSALAFIVLIIYKIYPTPIKSINLDTDWFYRRLAPAVIGVLGRWIDAFDRMVRVEALSVLRDVITSIERQYGARSSLSGTVQVGTMVLIVAGVLLLFLLVSLF